MSERIDINKDSYFTMVKPHPMTRDRSYIGHVLSVVEMDYPIVIVRVESGSTYFRGSEHTWSLEEFTPDCFKQLSVSMAKRIMELDK